MGSEVLEARVKVGSLQTGLKLVCVCSAFGTEMLELRTEWSLNSLNLRTWKLEHWSNNAGETKI